jgi:MFS family permease
MNAPNHKTAAKRLREWWASPPRSGLQRLIIPWEYRHLRVFGVMRMAGGIVAAGIGAFILSYGAYGWAAFFLVVGAANLAVGYWEITSLAPHLPEPEPVRGDIAAIDPPD